MLLYCVCFVLLFRIWAIFFQVQVPGGLYSEGRFNRGFFALRVGGGGIFGVSYTWGAYFRTFTVTDRHNK